MGETTERRAGERAFINAEFATIEEFVSEYASNISLTGCFIRSHKPLPRGTLVELHFTVLDSNLAIIEGQGEVVRTTSDGMGIRFTDLTDTSREQIRDFLAQRA